MRAIHHQPLFARHFGAAETLLPIAKFLTRFIAPAPAHLCEASCGTVPQAMAKGETVWINQPFGRTIFCLHGRLWLCFDGTPVDIVLDPGESHPCMERSPLSIHALSPAAVRVA